GRAVRGGGLPQRDGTAADAVRPVPAAAPRAGRTGLPAGHAARGAGYAAGPAGRFRAVTTRPGWVVQGCCLAPAAGGERRSACTRPSTSSAASGTGRN